MRTVKSLTTDELKAAALKYVTENGPVQGHQVAGPVLEALGSGFGQEELGVQYAWAVHEARVKVHTRLMGILNALAKEGKLLKVGRGEVKPSGGHPVSNTTFWYTQEQWAAAARFAAAARLEKEAERQRWESIRRRLHDGPGVYLDSHHKVSPLEWEAILDKAGW